ncbi:hypothetical protein [Streptococcus anginosus]|uniref:hypothetical protein n=1 Tax=Streptococcus anginosus TaxID=1328 RepID=UPI0021F8AC46|nr:hypothetical protein [Streptococcus anginosus]
MPEEKKYPQTEYNKKWIEKNKEHRNYLSSRSSARSFIRNKATKDDLDELNELIQKNLKKFE